MAATEDQLRLIHRNKTGALINAAIQMGAAAAKADEAQCRALEQYAYGLGLVFQIVDDVLDVTSTPEQLGKPIGSDTRNCTGILAKKLRFWNSLRSSFLCVKTKNNPYRIKEKDYAAYS
ncbi:Farnesyl diphosphate synthase [uncultured Clostridium sp.]|nr:Farnesyl diphosphate synthase [uncultured Clostridium sp.]